MQNWAMNICLDEKTGLLPVGGIQLSDITHNFYHMASLVKVDRIFVTMAAPPTAPAVPKILQLGDFNLMPYFFQSNAIEKELGKPALSKLTKLNIINDLQKNLPLGLLPAKLMNPSTVNEQFAFHNGTRVGYIVAAYVQYGPNGVLGLGEGEYLVIIQKYLFHKMGRIPPHEPSGILAAARFFPLVEFHTNCAKIHKIRADYQMDVGLDWVLPNDSQQKLARTWKLKPTSAGVFRDKDSVPPWAGAALVAEPLGLMPDFTLSDAFDAYEKPIVYEICANGLIGGLPGQVNYNKFPPFQKTTWDNLHFWSSWDELPSTPGAPQALHTHWRWNRQTQGRGDPFLDLYLRKYKGFPADKRQFIGTPIAEGPNPLAPMRDDPVDDMGWPIIDPAIPNQSISFAIVKREFEPNTKAESFAEMFTTKHLPQPLSPCQKDPGNVKAGAEITLWISYEAIDADRMGADGNMISKPARLAAVSDISMSPPPAPWSGVFFIQGMYFAHSNESANNLFKDTAGVGGCMPPHTNSDWDWNRTPIGTVK